MGGWAGGWGRDAAALHLRGCACHAQAGKGTHLFGAGTDPGGCGCGAPATTAHTDAARDGCHKGDKNDPRDCVCVRVTSAWEERWGARRTRMGASRAGQLTCVDYVLRPCGLEPGSHVSCPALLLLLLWLLFAAAPLQDLKSVPLAKKSKGSPRK